MWFQLRDADASFCERSPFQFRNSVVLPLDLDRAFDLIASERELAHWLEDFVSATWTSAPPHGVGATREVRLKILAVREKFLVWERGKRLTFTFTATTLPMLGRAVEDLRLVRLGPQETRVDWTVHYTPRLFMRPLHPIMRLVFGRLLRKSAQKLGKLGKRVAKNGASVHPA